MAMDNEVIPKTKYNKVLLSSLNFKTIFDNHKYTKAGINPITQ